MHHARDNARRNNRLKGEVKRDLLVNNNDVGIRTAQRSGRNQFIRLSIRLNRRLVGISLLV